VIQDEQGQKGQGWQSPGENDSLTSSELKG